MFDSTNLNLIGVLLIIIIYGPVIASLLLARDKVDSKKYSRQSKIPSCKKGEFLYKFWAYPFASNEEAIYFTICPPTGSQEEANELAAKEFARRFKRGETVMTWPLVPCN
jgi:hypothetical protein